MSTARIIIDVREPLEYEVGHVQNALNIPLSKLTAMPDKLKEIPKDTEIIAYCLSGSRSNSFIQILSQLGFTNLINGVNADNVTKKYIN